MSPTHLVCAVTFSSHLEMAGCMSSCLLILLAWALVHFLPGSKGPPVTNYDDTIYFNHESLRTPSTKEEIVEVVKSASKEGRKIRVVGSGHSWSHVAHSTDILLSLHNYAGVVSVDVPEKRITVQAGMTFHTLNAVLDQHGLAMKNLGSISAQTVAGAISTGTHGTGLKFGNLATLVTKLELISGSGEIITASADENPELFKAAQVSIGMLGVITEVTFQCVDKFNLEETMMPHSLDFCLENIQQLASSAHHVKLWTELNSWTCAVFQINETNEQSRNVPNRLSRSLQVGAYEGVLLIASWLPSLASRIMQLLFQSTEVFLPHNYVHTSYEVLNIPHYIPRENEGEVAVAVEDCAESIREIKRVVDRFSIPLNFVQEVRFVQADDIWLSPEYNRDSCRITLSIYNPSEENRLLYIYESYKALKKFSPRVHWGKVFQVSPAEVKAMYPRFQDFARVRAQMDPKRIFLNEQLAKTFDF